MMIYAKFIDANGTEQQGIYHTMGRYFSDTFSPATVEKSLISFKIHGKTYAERKACARNLAIAFQSEAPELSYMELLEVGNFFHTVGARYGLLGEFQENGIA